MTMINRTIAISLGLLLFWQHALALDSTKTIVFGVVPQQSTDKLIKSWSPVIQHLRKELRQPVRFATAPGIGEFERRCQAGEYDLAYMNPFHYITYASEPGYRVIANQSHKKLYGIVVVPQHSGLSHWQDLQSLTIHFPSPNAFAASLLVQAELRRRNIIYSAHYAGSHDSVYRNVALNIAHAGGGIERTLQTQPAALSDKLRILATTRGYTPHAFAVHPRLSSKLASRIQQALFSLPEPVLKPLNLNPLQAASDADYDDIRELKLDRF